jgi:hypothetical protein
MKRISTLFTAALLLGGTAFAQEDCSTATPAGSTTFNWVQVGSTVGFADDYDEACNAPFDNVGGSDVVYSYTPAATGFIELSLCSPGTLTDYDTKLYVYEGSCPTPGTGATGTQLACNDDVCSSPLFPVGPFISEITDIPVTAGTTYFVVVDGWSAADAGTFLLVCQEDLSPPTGSDIAQGEGALYAYTYQPNYNTSASTFASLLANTGSTTLNNCVSTLNVFSDADGFAAPIFTDASAPLSIPAAGVEIVTGTTPFTPPGNGIYIFEYVASTTDVNDVTANDTFNAFLVVTDTFQERSQAFLGAPISAVRLATLDPSAEYGVIQTYGTDVDVIGSTILVSVDPVFLAEPITANLYEILGGDVDSLSLVATASVPADTGALVYDIPLSASLTAGVYILAYAGQSFPVRTDFIYAPGASDLLRAAVTSGFWGAFAGPYAWSQVLWTAEAAPSCNSNILPTNLTSTQLSNRFELNWDPTPGAVACQLQGQGLPGPNPTVNLLSGDISSTNVPFAVAGPGNTYTWRVRCACSISPVDASAFTAYEDTFTIPVARMADVVDLAMFPNPADNQLMVSFSTESNDAVVTVIDMLGRNVLSSNEAFVAGQNNITFDVSGLEPGTYFVRIEEGEGVRTEEFAVAR